MGNDSVFMHFVKFHIQLWNSINNVNTDLIYSVTDIPFEAGIDHVFILERNHTIPKQFNKDGKHYKLKLWRNDSILCILKKKGIVELQQRFEWTVMNLSGWKLIQNKWR